MLLSQNGALRIDAVLRGPTKTFAFVNYLVRDLIASAATS
jgi:hypothetical protein